MNKKTKIILASALLLSTVYGVSKFSGSPHAGEAPQMPPMPVTVLPAVEKEVVEWDEFSGRLEAVDKVDIRPRVSGTIDAVHFTEGAMVKKGDLLFTIDPRPYEAEKKRTEALLNSAKARLKLARIEYDRAKPLLKDKAITQREYDVRQNNLFVAEGDFNAAQAAFEKAQLDYDYAHVKAPINGKVSRAEITVGNMVQSQNNPPLLTSIVSFDPIYVNFEADEQAFLRYQQASTGLTGLDAIPVYMGLANEAGTPHQGRITSFDNQLNITTGTIRVRAQFVNQGAKFVPGLYARVKIGGSGKKPAILIKDESIGTDQNKKYVMVVDDKNKANYREVKLGPVVDGMRVVRDGIKAGEKIVVSGWQKLRPGADVVPESADAKPQEAEPASGS